MTQTQSYDGSLEQWIPPSNGFAPVPWEDEYARGRAAQLAASLLAPMPASSPATLGEAPDDALALWSFRDERAPAGDYYRFFRYAHPTGQAIGALRYVGEAEAATLGAGEDPGQALQDSPVYPAAQDVAALSTAALCVAGNPTVSTFQYLYNTQIDVMAADPSFTGPLPAKLTVDGKYGPASADAVNQTLGGGAPAACAVFSGGGGGGGPSSPEPVPADDANCHYLADATNASIIAIANSISYQNTPVAWRDQGTFATTASDGSKWILVMWMEGGKRMVAAYRCQPKGGGVTPPNPPTPPVTPPPSSGSSGGGAGAAVAIVVALLAAAGGAWAYSSGRI